MYVLYGAYQLALEGKADSLTKEGRNKTLNKTLNYMYIHIHVHVYTVCTHTCTCTCTMCIVVTK